MNTTVAAQTAANWNPEESSVSGSARVGSDELGAGILSQRCTLAIRASRRHSRSMTRNPIAKTIAKMLATRL